MRSEDQSSVFLSGYSVFVFVNCVAIYIGDSYSSNFILLILQHRCPISELLSLSRLPSRGGFLVATPVFLRFHLNSRALPCIATRYAKILIIENSSSSAANFQKNLAHLLFCLKFRDKIIH